jgi:hypothetical protein
VSGKRIRRGSKEDSREMRKERETFPERESGAWETG